MTFADSPFVLLAHVHVKPDCVDQYLEIAATVDKAVEDSDRGCFYTILTLTQAIPVPLRGQRCIKMMKRYSLTFKIHRSANT
ncbi:MAG: hypothetical protein CM1200mP25_4030 [Acidobacteriota bacterium]|nr:MAG: hypothetical protein CM1200mP25_4030 [Acidobacteriota bacterium]